MLVKNPYVKFILKGQGIFSLDVNKILRLQVTLNSRYAKNVIRYSFFRIFAEGQESHVSQTNRVFLKRGLQPHSGSCFFFILGALRLVNVASPRNIDQKKISSGTQGINNLVLAVALRQWSSSFLSIPQLPKDIIMFCSCYFYFILLTLSTTALAGIRSSTTLLLRI